jgi:hypothetical protein
MSTGLGREDIRAPWFTTVDEALDLVKQAYPGRPIPAEVRILLTEIVDSIKDH